MSVSLSGDVGVGGTCNCSSSAGSIDAAGISDWRGCFLGRPLPRFPSDAVFDGVGVLEEVLVLTAFVLGVVVFGVLSAARLLSPRLAGG